MLDITIRNVFLITSAPVLRSELKTLIEESGKELVAAEPWGEAALKLIGALTPDVILLDEQLTGALWTEVTRDILQTAAAPVVLLRSGTGTGGTMTRAERMLAGAWLERPFDRTSLEQAMLIAGARFPDMLELREKDRGFRGCSDHLDSEVDTSELELTESELREKTELLNNITDNMFDLVLLADLQAITTYVSPSYRTMGYDPEQLIGTSVFDHVHPEDLESIKAITWAAMRSPDPQTGEYRWLRADGEVLWVESIGKLLLDKVGQPTGMIVSSRDITHRKQSEEKLKASERIFNHIQDMVCIAGFDGYFKVLNPAWSRVLGWTREELLANPWMDYVHPKDREGIPLQRAILSERQEVLKFEVRYRCSDGGFRWLAWNTFSYPEEGVVFGVARDVTDSRADRQALQDSAAALAEAQSLANLGSWNYNIHTRELRWSEQMFRLYGIDPASGEPPWPEHQRFIHPDDWEELNSILTRAVTQGLPHRARFRFIDSQGQVHWAMSIGQVEVDDHGEAKSLFGTVQDITDNVLAEEALVRNEAKYRPLVESTEAILWEFDFVGDQWTYVAPQVKRILGYEPEEFTDMAFWRDHLHEEDREWAPEYCLRHTLRGESHQYEYRFLKKDGQTVWLRDVVNVDTEDGRPSRLRGFMLDISKTKLVEMEREQAILSASHRAMELESLLKAAELMLSGGNFPETARHIFDAAREMTGAVSGYIALLSSDGRENEVLFLEAGGHTCSVDPDQVMPVRGLRAEAYKYGQAVVENNFMTSRWLEFLPPGHVNLRNVMFAPLNIEGKTVGIMGLANKPGDFTDDDMRISEAFSHLAAIALKNSRLSRELLEQKNFFEQMFLQSSISTQILDKDGWCVRINPKLSKIFGVEPQHIEGRIYNIFKDEGIRQGGIIPHLDKVFKEGRTAEWEVCFDIGIAAESQQIQVKEKKKVWYSNWSYPIFDEKGELSHVIIQHTDITSRIELEREKDTLHEQLQQAMKMEAIGRLAGGIAHDFNNLLTGIIGNVELALMDLEEGEPVAHVLEEVSEASHRAAALTRQLLAFSRKQVIQPRIMDLNTLLHSMQKMLVRLIGEDVDLQLIPEAAPWSVRIDPGQFEQILVNLAVNARDAMPQGGSLVIETSNVNLDAEYSRAQPQAVPGDYVLLTVTDSGHGMSEGTLAHLFEPFFTTKPMGKGTGLGLATTYGVVKQANGFIEVRSELGLGTSFKVYLPRASGSSGAEAPDSHGTPLLGGSETILLVEDEQLVREMAIKILKRLGYHVLHAESGAQALALAEAYMGPIHLLLTDVVMPGLNGRQLAERLVELHPESRVLYSSGYSEDIIGQHGVLESGIAFIGKPYTLQIIAKKVRELLDAGK